MPRAPRAAVKHAPFSAEAISESVQTLADGNRIVRSSSSKLFRNSEGRFRREMTSGSGGMLGSLYAYGQGVTLLDPVGGFRYPLDPNLKTAHQVTLRPSGDVRIVTSVGAATVNGTVVSDKVRSEIHAAIEARGSGGSDAIISDKVREQIKSASAAVAAVAPRAITGQTIGDGGEGFTTAYSIGVLSNSNWDKRTEELGVQNIEGVDAEGTRTITTIPAGAIGNERPIEITYEKWYSRELQLVVMSRHNDPRFGEQTYRLTNIIRSDPDPSLFTLPNGYKVITEPSRTYTISAAKAVMAEQKAAAAARAATPLTKTKP